MTVHKKKHRHTNCPCVYKNKLEIEINSLTGVQRVGQLRRLRRMSLHRGRPHTEKVVEPDAQTERQVTHRRDFHILRLGAPQHADVHHLDQYERSVRGAIS